MKISLGRTTVANTILSYVLIGNGMKNFCIEVEEVENDERKSSVKARLGGNGLGYFFRFLKFGFLLKKEQVFANTLPGIVEDYCEEHGKQLVTEDIYSQEF